MHYLILVIYWFIFWRDKIKNPYQLCTSELASTYFPFWVYTGRNGIVFFDNIYYKYPFCIPFLSTFYPTKILTVLARWLPLDQCFRVFSLDILLHCLLGSFIAYHLFLPFGETGALFGAITLTYSGYVIKPQTPAFMYTAAWIPGMFINDPLFSSISLGFAILGGYWPILVYVLPVAIIFNHECLYGLLIGLIQIVPFIWYWPKSVRSGQEIDDSFGRINLRKFINLIIPNRSTELSNGVHYPESEMYMGLATCLAFQNLTDPWWIAALLGILIAVGIAPQVQRIPTRSLYLVTLAFSFVASKNHPNIALLLFQSFLLLWNSRIYPSFPFSQLWKKPSELYSDYKDKESWPLFSGYLFNKKHTDYKGAFALK